MMEFSLFFLSFSLNRYAGTNHYNINMEDEYAEKNKFDWYSR